MKKTARILALLLALMLVFTCSACSMKAAQMADSEYGYADYKSNGYTEEESASVKLTSKSEGYYAEAESYSEEMSDDSPVRKDDPADAPDFSEKIIYSAYISLQTTEFDRSVAALENSVKQMGGFIENSDTSGNVRYESDGSTRVVDRSANYTVRIPVASFDTFLQQSSDLGNVLNSTKTAENVTSAYTDYEARLSSLRIQEERLLAMLEKAETVETLIELESRLSEVRYEIESIERNLRNLDSKISYSTVTLFLREVEIYTPTANVQRTFGQKLRDAFHDGWSRFGRSIQNFCVNLTEALPALLILAVIVVAVLLIIRRIRRKHRAAKAAKAGNNTPTQE